MNRYLSGIGCAAIVGAAMLLSLGTTPAEARAPGGSYRQTCTDVRASGDRVVATCRRENGTWQRSVINNVDSCVGGLANTNGRLTCGRSGGHRYSGRHHRGHYQGYGSSYAPNYSPYHRGGNYYWYGR